MKTVLAIDDHAIVLEGLQKVLEAKDFIMLKAMTPECAMAMLQAHSVDVVVCDLSIHGADDGLGFIEDMRRAGFRQPTVVYTMHEELWNIAALSKADVEGVVLKGDNISELVNAIESVAAGRRYHSGAFYARCAEVIHTGGILSAKDIDVLRRISRGAASREISEELCISTKAVEYHRANILRKLCARTIPEAVRRALELGVLPLLALLMYAPVARGGEPQPVDLGLSVCWADRNLGADTPDEAGWYQAFAETAPKQVYNWNTYVHCDDGDMFLCHDLGTDDIAGTEFDAATAVLGSRWRMPTAAEFVELQQSCSVSFSGDGRNAVVTGPNGVSVSFPLCGYMQGDKPVHTYMGTYYTSGCEIEEEYDEDAGITYRIISPFYAAFSSGQILVPLMGSAHLGMMVRPVLAAGSSSQSVTVGAGREIHAVYTLSGLRLDPDAIDDYRGVFIVGWSDGTYSKFVR